MDRLPFFIQQITSVMGTDRCPHTGGRWQKGDSFILDLSGRYPRASGSTQAFDIDAEGSDTSLTYTVSGEGMDHGRVEVTFRYCGTQEVRSYGPADKFIDDICLLFGLNSPSIYIFDSEESLVSKTPPSAATCEQDAFFTNRFPLSVSVSA